MLKSIIKDWVKKNIILTLNLLNLYRYLNKFFLLNYKIKD